MKYWLRRRTVQIYKTRHKKLTEEVRTQATIVGGGKGEDDRRNNRFEKTLRSITKNI